MKLLKLSIRLPKIYEVPASQIKRRDLMLARSAAITTVETAQQQDVAAAFGSALQKHLREVEDARKALSRPLKAAQERLIQLERDYLKPLVETKNRLAGLVSAFQLREQQRVQQVQELQRREQERLENERLVLARRAAETQDVGEQIRLEQQANDAMEAASLVLATVPAEPAKASGAATRAKLCYKVTDLAALYAAAPHLIRLELNAAAVLEHCTKDTKLPGITFWEESRTLFR